MSHPLIQHREITIVDSIVPKKKIRKVTIPKPSLERQVLEKLAIPALQSMQLPESPKPQIVDIDEEGGGQECARGQVLGSWPVEVTTSPIDEQRHQLRFSLLMGYVISNNALAVLMIGNWLDPGPFRVRPHFQLGMTGEISLSCDLTVCLEDRSLIERRLSELSRAADQISQLMPLRMPQYIHWGLISGMELDWMELPHDDVSRFLDEGLAVPPDERTPLTLLIMAQGLERWSDVLRLLKEHPKELPAKKCAPLKCLALHEQKRWLPAIKAARAGGIKKGCWPEMTSASPSYTHALIEAGDEIEAMRILGKYREGGQEPAHYDWLRGLAFQRAGEEKLAGEAFERHFVKWPNDVVGANMLDVLSNS